LCPKADYVLTQKDSKSVYKVVNGETDEKESLMVLFTVNAVVIVAPPMILFKNYLIRGIYHGIKSEWILIGIPFFPENTLEI